MGYVLIEWKKLKSYFPEFQEMVAMLEQQSLSLCSKVWPGMTYGRFNPLGTTQYGRTTFLPELFMDQNNDVLDDAHSPTWWGVNSFKQYFTSTSPTAVAIPGWKQILQGAGAGGITPEDVIMNLIGFAILDESILFSKLRLEIGDIVHVKMDCEEIHMYEQPAIIFEEGYTIPEETYLRLRGFFEASGFQRVVPLGFMLYRRKDTLVHI